MTILCVDLSLLSCPITEIARYCRRSTDPLKIRWTGDGVINKVIKYGNAEPDRSPSARYNSVCSKTRAGGRTVVGLWSDRRFTDRRQNTAPDSALFPAANRPRSPRQPVRSGHRPSAAERHRRRSTSVSDSHRREILTAFGAGSLDVWCNILFVFCRRRAPTVHLYDVVNVATRCANWHPRLNLSFLHFQVDCSSAWSCTVVNVNTSLYTLTANVFFHR